MALNVAAASVVTTLSVDQERDSRDFQKEEAQASQKDSSEVQRYMDREVNGQGTVDNLYAILFP